MYPNGNKKPKRSKKGQQTNAENESNERQRTPRECTNKGEATAQTLEKYRAYSEAKEEAKKLRRLAGTRGNAKMRQYLSEQAAKATEQARECFKAYEKARQWEAVTKAAAREMQIR